MSNEERSFKKFQNSREKLWKEIGSAFKRLMNNASTHDYGPFGIEEETELYDDGEQDDGYIDLSYKRFENEIEQSIRYGDFDEITEFGEYAADSPTYRTHRLNKYLSAINKSITRKDLPDLSLAWLGFKEAIDDDSNYGRFDLAVAKLREQIETLIEELEINTPVLFYHSPQIILPSPSIEIPKLVIGISEELIAKISRQPDILFNLTPRKFEELIAEIFSGFGYLVELTAQTRDGGRDIVAVKNEHDISVKLLIECKKYSPKRPVGVSLVRELYAVKALERASKAILATTSYFSADARALEKKLLYELELKDFNSIVNWVSEYNAFLRKIRS